MVDTWNGDVVVLTLEQATRTLQAAARAAQINPNASIASATRRKPVMFAPMM